MKHCLNSCGKEARIYSRRGDVEATDKRKSCGLMWPRKKPVVTHAAGLSGNGNPDVGTLTVHEIANMVLG
jgi:hypothetical protein